MDKDIHHNIIMENRNKLLISGVKEIVKYDDKSVVLFTSLGEVTISGENIYVNSASIVSGELTMTGQVNAIIYGKKDSKTPDNFITKIFR